MYDHDHAGLVAQWGLCTVCARAKASDQISKGHDGAVAAGASAPPDWRRKALAAVVKLTEGGGEFTADDVWLMVPPIDEPRAMGAVFLEAKRLGYVTATGASRVSRHPLGHGRLVRVWRPAQQRLTT